jgi:hypothetical protein
LATTNKSRASFISTLAVDADQQLVLIHIVPDINERFAGKPKRLLEWTNLTTLGESILARVAMQKQ